MRFLGKLPLRNGFELAQLLGIKSKPLVYHGFVSHEPFPPLMDPGLDAYLVRLGARWSHNADVRILTTPLLPGELEHLLEFGFNPQLIEHARPDASLRHGDPVTYLARQGATNRLLGSTVLSSFVTKGLRDLGQTLFSPEVSALANSKITMREGSKQFEFLMPPGEIVYSFGQALTAIQHLNFPLWAKADGAGSDFNYKIESSEQLEIAFKELIRRMIAGWQTLPPDMIPAETSNHIQTWQEFLASNLPTDILFPLPIVLETDIGRLGKILANFCWQFIVTNDGAYEIGCSSQLLSPNAYEWWGSSSDLPAIMQVGSCGRQIGLVDAMKLCDWFYSLGYRGCIGPDAFLVEEFDTRKLKVFWIDPNGRPAMSTTPFMVHNAFLNGKGGWVNTNLTLPRPVESMADITTVLDEYLLSPHGRNGVSALLLASRTEPGEPSQVVKMMFMSREGVTACQQIIAKLPQKGIRVGS